MNNINKFLGIIEKKKNQSHKNRILLFNYLNGIIELNNEKNFSTNITAQQSILLTINRIEANTIDKKNNVIAKKSVNVTSMEQYHFLENLKKDVYTLDEFKESILELMKYYMSIHPRRKVYDEVILNDYDIFTDSDDLKYGMYSKSIKILGHVFLLYLYVPNTHPWSLKEYIDMNNADLNDDKVICLIYWKKIAQNFNLEISISAQHIDALFQMIRKKSVFIYNYSNLKGKIELLQEKQMVSCEFIPKEREFRLTLKQSEENNSNPFYKTITITPFELRSSYARFFSLYEENTWIPFYLCYINNDSLNLTRCLYSLLKDESNKFISFTDELTNSVYSRISKIIQSYLSDEKIVELFYRLAASFFIHKNNPFNINRRFYTFYRDNIRIPIKDAMAYTDSCNLKLISNLFMNQVSDELKGMSCSTFQSFHGVEDRVKLFWMMITYYAKPYIIKDKDIYEYYCPSYLFYIPQEIDEFDFLFQDSLFPLLL